MFKLLVIVVVAGLVLAFTAVRIVGAARWNSGTQALRSALDAGRKSGATSRVDFTELEELPAPVQRFFRSVVKDGHPMIAGVHLRHMGTFNMSETGEQWKAFTSDQQVVTQRPGFDWDGRIAMLPGVPVRVHDAYVAGEGILYASVLGAITVANLRGGGDIARGELMRFLAEAAWYPTALLPSQGVRWTAIDERSASATLDDGSVAVTLTFTFLSDGPIESVAADARARIVGGALVHAPWHGRFWNYEVHAGVRIPVDGEVAWMLPSGPKPYWRGHTTDVVFTFAP